MQRPKWRDSTFLKGHLGKLRERGRVYPFVICLTYLNGWLSYTQKCRYSSPFWILWLSISVNHFSCLFFPTGWLTGWRSWHSYTDGFGTKFWRQRCERTAGRDLVTTQRNSCDQRDYLRVTIFLVCNKNPIGKWARYGVILFLFLGRPLVFGRLFVSGVSGWPKCFFLGEVTKWAKWFEGKISGWMLTDDRTNKNWIQFGREIWFKCHPVT